MKVVYWSPDDLGKPEEPQEPQEPREYEFSTLGELWHFIETGVGSDFFSDTMVLEISANEEKDGTPYLVLTWVGTEDE